MGVVKVVANMHERKAAMAAASDAFVALPGARCCPPTAVPTLAPVVVTRAEDSRRMHTQAASARLRS